MGRVFAQGSDPALNPCWMLDYGYPWGFLLDSQEFLKGSDPVLDRSGAFYCEKCFLENMSGRSMIIM